MVVNHLDVVNGEDGRSRHVIRYFMFSDISSWTPAQAGVQCQAITSCKPA
jgi:hypothetical protein